MSARTEPMLAARRLATLQKRAAALAAAQALLDRGFDLNIEAIARRAGCSSKFIHDHKDLKAELELMAARAAGNVTAAITAEGRLSEASLRVELDNYKGLAERHRQEIRSLKARLGELQGATIEADLPAVSVDAVACLRETEQLVTELQRELLNLRERLNDTEDELDAARRLNRELVRTANTGLS